MGEGISLISLLALCILLEHQHTFIYTVVHAITFSLLAFCILLVHQHTLLAFKQAFTDLNNDVIHPALVVHCLN